jgi:uncharacterized SAM-binding protein YcdF (DUF218 family)
VSHPRRLPLKLFVAAAVFLALVLLTHSLWLAAMGRLLVRNDGPAPADIAVVLAGDFYGRRILTAGDLVRARYVPRALVSGPANMYGNYECDLAIAFAVRHGYPADYFVRFPNTALSTVEEADAILPELRRRNVHRFLLVTSNYHTARAIRIYRARGRGFDIRAVAAPDEHFTPDGWWRDREARKTVFYEYSKTVAGFFNF